MLRYLFFVLICMGFVANAQNTTKVEPEICFEAKAEQSNIEFISIYSTVVYALARALQPSLSIFNKAMSPTRTNKETSKCVVALLEGFHGLESSGSVLINGLQVVSIISTVVPMIWYPGTQDAGAECNHAKDRINSNSTRPLACYLADAADDTFRFEIGYPWGLFLGVYLFLPWLITVIGKLTSGCCEAPEVSKSIATAPSPGEAAEAPKEIATAPTGEAGALEGGLNVASMVPDKYSLFDNRAWTFIISYVAAMIFSRPKYRAREKCNSALANQTAHNDPT